MRKKTGLFLMIILAGLLLFSNCKLIPIKFAPDLGKEFEKLGINFEDKESILQLERVPELFRLWAKWKPIKLSMTKEEKKFIKKILKIEDAEQRNYYAEKVIEWFWARRDDNSYDDLNEHKEKFYDRVVEAQTRFADKEGAQYSRKCKYGKGWETDMGIIYIILGEPFDKARYDVNQLMSFSNSNYQQSILIPQDIEIWYYEVYFDRYNSSSFQDGVAWIAFERDWSGYWSLVSVDMFNLFYNYENYSRSRFMRMSLSYSTYISDIDKLLKAFAEENIYDWDLAFEDVLIKWVPIKK